MATRPRVRSTRSTRPPAIDLQRLDGESEGASPSPAEDGDAPASLPDIKLQGSPVPVPSREARIEIAAYQKAEARGFEPGYEVDDWLSAEREIDAADSGDNAARE